MSVAFCREKAHRIEQKRNLINGDYPIPKVLTLAISFNSTRETLTRFVERQLLNLAEAYLHSQNRTP